jgi:hypothetical protein
MRAARNATGVLLVAKPATAAATADDLKLYGRVYVEGDHFGNLVQMYPQSA